MNVAVAWGFAWFVNVADVDDADWRVLGAIRHGDRFWLAVEASAPGSAAVVGIAFINAEHMEDLRSWEEEFEAESEFPESTAADLPSWSGLRDRPELVVGPSYLQPVRLDVARGWPLPALSCRLDAPLEADLLHPAQVTRGLKVGEFPGGSELGLRVLPCSPIASGLIVGSGSWALVLWLLGAIPLALIRHGRARRGLCPKCAYPMGESPMCSECGATLPKRRAVK